MSTDNLICRVAGAQLFPRSLRLRYFMWPTIGLLLTVSLIPFTDTTYGWIHSMLRSLPLDEVFSTTRQITGVTVLGTIFLVFLFIAPSGLRRCSWWLAVALLLGCAVNSGVKELAGRVRPEFGIGIQQMSAEDDGYRRMKDFIDSHPGTALRLEQKDQWLLLKSGRPWGESMTVSFPSGHSMTAFCLAAFFSVLFPRGKWLWYLWAWGCALSRVWGRRHYIDDALMGAVVGHLSFLFASSWAWPGAIGSMAEDLLKKCHLISESVSEDAE
ncbi:MAG: phosphatase PAP2 family protein [Candidatus Sumerlaeales bacterium]|nr:phosphatase PAP2 family protein [Candidatus Sumerlaeales bacterium]